MFLFLHKLISLFLELKLNYECATSLAASELVEVACQPGLFFWGGEGGGKIKREKKVGGERENEPARKLMIVFRDQPPN